MCRTIVLAPATTLDPTSMAIAIQDLLTAVFRD
jgi:hypothetical protein